MCIRDRLNQFMPTGTNCISLFRYMRWTTQLNPNPRKCDPATYVWTLAVARWAQDNSKVTQNLKTKWKWHPDTMFFVFVTWFSVHFAKHHEAHLRSHHITTLAASHLHEWPTYTRATNARETHTIQWGVGGMRRKPGKFPKPISFEYKSRDQFSHMQRGTTYVGGYIAHNFLGTALN